jgi:hypothetical protein
MGEKPPWRKAMSKRVLILVEGQTEEHFTKEILYPYFCEKEIYLTPTLLKTKVVKNGPDFKGGVTTFGKIENDINRLLSDKTALVTTMMDYYGLPSDTPGFATRPESSPIEKVTYVEESLYAHFKSPLNFIPFLVLHEYETLLFSSEIELPQLMRDSIKEDLFKEICRSKSTPEEINEGETTHPSKRIMDLYKHYRKVIHGIQTAQKIGLQTIISKCPHFSQWIKKIENYSFPS